MCGRLSTTFPTEKTPVGLHRIARMDSYKARERFLSFFEGKGHRKVPSSPLVPADDPTLMFTNAGMVQFKDVFLGFDRREYDKATTSQRCLRAGGKHNDLENVGYTARHHTFFEMLGNFSFGDYFKERAIPLAWELLTSPVADGGYGLKPERLWVTVFGGGDLFGDGKSVPADGDARRIWIDTLMNAGFDAKEAGRRVTDVPTLDNFWMMGDTGPCGPCSEIFHNRNADAERFEGEDPEHADSCLEIWNLVFMQFNRDANGALTPLPAPCVDTGMGLERLCAILQGKESNYDTDLFISMLDAVASAMTEAGGQAPRESASLRVIADHIRAAAYLVADRVLPSNEGRGYVLRRIIRRALRHGHQLGAKRPFFASLAKPLAEVMGDAHPELPARLGKVVEALENEEEKFARTLHDGMKVLDRHVSDKGVKEIDGATAFKLYDTYGFPADLTASYARDHGIEVDMEGFVRELAVQQERSRAASGFKVDLRALNYDGPSTRFARDLAERIDTELIAVCSPDGTPVEALHEGDVGMVVLAETAFYAESGGQVGDRGHLAGGDGESARVLDTFKVRGDVHGHRVEVTAGTLRKGTQVSCEVDREHRHAVCRAHSATHLLHEALRRRLGGHVEQKGSLVEGDRLRFDFTHDHHLVDADLDEVERIVYAQSLANCKVVTDEMPYDDAISLGAKALFGEKYGSTVRVVKIDQDFSVELCGGTHVASAAEVGFVRVLSDDSIAAGVRRIEARTGLLAQSACRQDARIADDLSRILKAPREDLVVGVSALQSSLRDERRRIDAMESAAVQAQVQGLAKDAIEVDGARVLVAKVDSQDMKAIKDQARSIAGEMGPSAVMLFSHGGDKVGLVAWVSKELQGRASAKEWVASCASELGARGGGNAELAQAGGGKPVLLEKAMVQARDTMRANLAGAS